MAQLIEEFIGHEEPKSRMLQSIQRGRIHPVQIFVGPSGVGKKKLAISMAQIIMCESPDGGACGRCSQCVRVSLQQSEGLLVVEPQGHQIKVEQSRQILQFLTLKSISKARVVIINEAQLFNPQSANALLKSLEEPAENVYFFLITSSLSSLLPTIRSRGQMLKFSPLSQEEMRAVLPEAEDWVIDASQGRVDLAQRLLAPDISDLRSKAFSVFEKYFESFYKQEIPLAVGNYVKESTKDKAEALFFIQCWTQIFRDAWLNKVGSGQSYIHPDYLHIIKEISKISHSGLSEITDALVLLERDLMGNVERQASFENFFFKLKEASAC